MKRKQFKISRSTLFVFQSSKSGETTTTVDTDPTTTMITTTVSGIFLSGRKS